MADELTAFAKEMGRCWLERRFGDLAAWLAGDVVMVAPGGAHRVEGVDAAVESYRAFMERSTVHRFTTSGLVVTERGSTAVIEYRWDMAWDDEHGMAHAASGREILVLGRLTAGWRVVWRTQLPA